MNSSNIYEAFLNDIRFNCEVSDARDHGIYSMCMMILRLRNLYKWEKNLEPWHEPEPSVLLDWIETKEHLWHQCADNKYRDLSLGGIRFDPFATCEANTFLADSGLFYGAGYGRAMKTVFFVGEIRNSSVVQEVPLVVIGRELVREMAGAMAFVQDGVIVVRRDLLRFFFWDQLQEMRSSCRRPFLYALDSYGLRTGDKLDQQRLKQRLDTVVDQEMDMFVYHELGEKLDKSLAPASLQTLVRRFPGSVTEFVVRAIKDLLADTHPEGLLARFIDGRRHSGIGFYVGFLDGLREKLFPEIVSAWNQFAAGGDWNHIEQARVASRKKCLILAEKIDTIAHRSSFLADSAVQEELAKEILVPLGLKEKSAG